jgi:hypothetical protein
MKILKDLRIENIIRSAEECLNPSSSTSSGTEVPTVQSEANCPHFPLEAFPEKIQKIAWAFHHYESFNMDYLCASLLTAFASAMGNQWIAHFTTSWYTAPILYVVLIGPASSGKTPPLRLATEPLRKYDAALDSAYNKEMKLYQQAMELPRENRVNNGFDEYPTKPKHHQLIVINTTIENLFSTLDQNRRGILMNVDELDSLTGNMSRYTNGTDETYWLEIFNGSQIKYSRKSSDDYINITHPYVSILSSTQPGMLSYIFGNKRSTNGFASRFLKVYPEIEDMPEWILEKMPESIMTDWNDIIDSVLSVKSEITSEGDIDSKIMEFSYSALEILIKWKKTVNSPKWKEAESEYVKSICGKLETYLVRLCLVIQVMNYVCDVMDDNCIDEGSVDAAIKLIEYFRAMDLRAFNAISHKPIDELHQSLYDKLPDTFSTAEAVSMGELLNTSESTVKRFLRDGIAQKYIKKSQHGIYSKIE